MKRPRQERPELSPGFVHDQATAELLCSAQRLADLLDSSYWQRLCPELHCTDQQYWDQHCAEEKAPMAATERSRLQEELRVEGYFKHAPGWSTQPEALAAGVAILVQHGWHPVLCEPPSCPSVCGGSCGS